MECVSVTSKRFDECPYQAFSKALGRTNSTFLTRAHDWLCEKPRDPVICLQGKLLDLSKKIISKRLPQPSQRD